MAGELQQLTALTGEVKATTSKLGDLHEHVEKIDTKVDTMSIQIAVMDTHVTKMTKENAETREQLGEFREELGEFRNLKAQLFGGMAVMGFIVTAIVEVLRIWFH